MCSQLRSRHSSLLVLLANKCRRNCVPPPFLASAQTLFPSHTHTLSLSLSRTPATDESAGRKEEKKKETQGSFPRPSTRVDRKQRPHTRVSDGQTRPILCELRWDGTPRKQGRCRAWVCERIRSSKWTAWAVGTKLDATPCHSPSSPCALRYRQTSRPATSYDIPCYLALSAQALGSSCDPGARGVRLTTGSRHGSVSCACQCASS